MKTFLLVAALSIGSGLAVRYMLHRHSSKAEAPQPAPVAIVPQHDEPPAPPPVEHVAPVPPPAPEPPPPPRIAGSTQISDATVQHFATAPGVIYYCSGGSVMAQPKSGGSAKSVGDCTSAFDFVADGEGVFYCDDHHLMRITTGTEGSHVVAETECIMESLDAKYAYFVVPGFEGIDNPGVYRVARAGGLPEKIYSAGRTEQFMVAADDDAVWIGSWAGGTISKLAKTPHASAKPTVTGQKGIVSIATDAQYLYWYSESTTEVRRRKKSGGAVEVVGHDVSQEPVRAANGHAYWFEGAGDTRLVDLAPGATKPETLASGLHSPVLRVDSEGVYVAELDREGIFMFKR